MFLVSVLQKIIITNLKILILLWVLFVAVASMIIFQFVRGSNSQLASIEGTKLGNAFKDSSQIMYAMICTVSFASSALLDLALDFFDGSEFSKWDDKPERFAMAFAIIIPGICVFQSAFSPHMHTVVAFSHFCQITGCFASIYSLCHKLIPKYFTFPGLLISYLFSSLAGALSFTVALDKPLYDWSNVLVFFCMLTGGAIPFLMISSWGKSVYIRLKSLPNKRSFFADVTEVLNENEVCCFLYLVCTFCTIMSIPSITACCCLFQWRNWGTTAICVNIYSLAAFSVLPSCIPGRLRQHYARKMIKEKIKTNHATIRYISHEIRSPLNVVHNGIKLLMEDLAEGCSKNIVEGLQDVLHASSAASNIIDDLLNFEKMDAGKFQMDKKLHPASVCLTSILKRCKILAKQKHITFTVNNLLKDVDGLVLALLMDVVKIEQVLRNLIVNSIKFTSVGGLIEILLTYEESTQNDAPKQLHQNEQTVSAHVVENALGKNRSWGQMWVLVTKLVSFWKGPAKVNPTDYSLKQAEIQNDLETTGWIKIVVKDNGAGITKDQYSKVFGEFNQFNANNLQGGGGSGLGLWICKEIIRQHQGEISFHSNGAGHGTEFSVLLNAKFYAREKLESSIPDEKILCGEGDQGGMRQIVVPSTNFEEFGGTNLPPCIQLLVLVVDDIQTNRRILMRMITKVVETCPGVVCNMREADDGITALECMNLPDKFNIVFIDNIMTSLNGPDAVAKMRQYGYQGLVIGVTGNVMDEDIQQFITQGANEILKKPVCAQQVGQIIRNCVNEMRGGFKNTPRSLPCAAGSTPTDFPEIIFSK